MRPYSQAVAKSIRPKAGEHLMVVYYDILLLDNDSLLGVRHSERRKILSNLIRCQLGWAELAKYEVIDFGHPLAASNLRNVFAKTIINRQEGLVLKVDEPYFDFAVLERPWAGRCIKLKKEYIGGFGDVGDFAVVGAGYDPTRAKHYDIAGLKWTHFYLGCLSNKDEVQRWQRMPEFNVVSVVELNQTQLRSIVQCGNPHAIPADENNWFRITIQPGISNKPAMSCVFSQPLVVDLRCFSFDKVGNTGFWSPRFPVVSRVHLDRDYMDALSFQQLQEKAKEAIAVQEQPDSQENLQWIARLESADPRGVAVDAVSQQTVTTMPTPSPRRSTQNSSQSWSLSPTLSRTIARSATQPAVSPATHFQAMPGPPSHPLLPLITPPTSSDPLPPTPTQEKKKQARKRSSPTGSQTPQVPKRRKSTDNKPPLAHSPMPRPGCGTPARRKPLAELGVNSSQPSSSASQPSNSRPMNRNMTSREPEVIDLTSSPDGSFETAPSRVAKAQGSPKSQDSGNTTLEVLKDSLNDAREALAAKKEVLRTTHDPNHAFASADDASSQAEQSRESQASTVASKDSDYVNLFLPGWDHAINNDEYPSQASQTAPSLKTVVRQGETALTGGLTEVGPSTEPARASVSRPILRSGCKFAGHQCHFSNRTLLLAPHLSHPSAEVAALLKDHNIEDAITDIKGWLVDEHKRTPSPSDPCMESNIVLLVDSLKYASEVEALCKEIHESRMTLSEEKRNWITLYDWRMLKHLTIHEDDGVTNKYYDGFPTPFRRWYAGVL